MLKSKRIEIRLNEEEYALLTKRANQFNCSKTEVLLSGLKSEKKDMLIKRVIVKASLNIEKQLKKWEDKDPLGVESIKQEVENIWHILN